MTHQYDQSLAEPKQMDNKKDQPINLAEASRKYNVPYRVVQNWVSRGHVKRLPSLTTNNRRVWVAEADVARRAEQYHDHKNRPTPESVVAALKQIKLPTELDQLIKEKLITAHFSHLKGHLISLYEATTKYGINHTTLNTWVKANHLKIVKQESTGLMRRWVDEAEMAYCALVYHQAKELFGTVRGVWLFDPFGNPYSSFRTNKRRRRSHSSKPK